MGYCVYSSLLSLSKARTSLWVLWNILNKANYFPWEGQDYNKLQILKEIKFPGRSLSINLQVIFPHSPLGITQTELCPALVSNVPSTVFRNKALTHPAKCKLNINVLPLPLVTLVRNCLCFKREDREISSQVRSRYSPAGREDRGQLQCRKSSSTDIAGCWQGCAGPCALTGSWRVWVFHNAGPHTAATENEAMVFFQFKESLDCQRNHITAILQMNSSNGTALGWPYLYWASQECQDFSIHKKCTSGTNYLCHFSSTPQSQMIHIVRRALVFGVACVSPLHRFGE